MSEKFILLGIVTGLYICVSVLSILDRLRFEKIKIPIDQDSVKTIIKKNWKSYAFPYIPLLIICLSPFEGVYQALIVIVCLLSLFAYILYLHITQRKKDKEFKKFLDEWERKIRSRHE